MTRQVISIPNNSNCDPVIKNVNENCRDLNKHVVTTDDVSGDAAESLGPEYLALYKVNMNDMSSV